MIERRKYGIRRDFNDLVRDESGKISGSKIGTYIGQAVSTHLLLKHTDPIPTWDVLAVLFCVLIAPEFYKRLMVMRYGGGRSETTETSKTTSTVTVQPQQPAK